MKMFENAKFEIKKHTELVSYIFFGALTTLVGFGTYAAAYYVLPVRGTTPSNLVSWVAAVLFAYCTNRKWVFQSEATGLQNVLKELLSFGSARLFALLAETFLLWLLVDRLYMPNLPVKLVLNVLVVVLNYLLSKFWVFKKAKGTGGFR
ncbi:MAG: GtrA family protein [Clostridiales Family XIII bacterium]|jgi:putative flippase GtrA|nr:GtrA family protein [Clostridiales Family XIII bacterium]